MTVDELVDRYWTLFDQRRALEHEGRPTDDVTVELTAVHGEMVDQGVNAPASELEVPT